MLHWVFKEIIPFTNHATSATWNKWVVLIMQQAQLGKPNHPRIWNRSWTGQNAEILEHCLRKCLVPKRHNHVMNYQKMEGIMVCLLMDAVVL